MSRRNINPETENNSPSDLPKKRRTESCDDNIEVLEAPKKFLMDQKEYRVIKLQNGLTVTLVSVQNSLKQDSFISPDPAYEDISDDSVDNDDDGKKQKYEEETKDGELMDEEKKAEQKEKQIYLSAASLCIRVGHFQNPREMQGLMYFLKHMVTMGSEKYPEENSFFDYIEKFGGRFNSVTNYEVTTFHFNVLEMHFEKTLDIFANFFISPLMTKDAIQKKRKILYSEFKSLINSDYYRTEHLMATIANSDHPISFFKFVNEKFFENISDEELYSKLHEMRSKYYIAQYMTLAVQASESLDKLQELVISIFSKIPNTASQKPSYEGFVFPFSQKRFNRLYKVISVKDRHILELRWTMTNMAKQFCESKDLYFISQFLGQEGNGSIISYLKRRVWAVLIAPGKERVGFNCNSTCVILAIEIELTDDGFLHVPEIIEVVFQYIRLLQRTDPRGRMYAWFKEAESNLAKSLDFAEEKPSNDSVLNLALAMQLYPSKYLFTHFYLLHEYDAYSIAKTLSCITVSNCHIMLTSKQFKNESLTLQKEECYGTKYCIEEIPQNWINTWENSKIHDDLFLPMPINVIPNQFEIHKWSDTSRDPPQYPQRIESNDRGILWFKQDFKFGLPKAFCYIYFVFQDICNSPEMAAMVDLFVNLLSEKIISSSFFTIEEESLGFVIQFKTFEPEIHSCLKLILKHLEEFDSCLDDNLFNNMKQHLLRSYHNVFHYPRSFGRDVCYSILYKVHWGKVEKMKALEKIEMDTFISKFMENVFTKKYITMLVQGNIKAEEAKKLFYLVLSSSSHSSCKSKLEKIKLRRCKPGVYVSRVKSLNSASLYTYVSNYYQGGKFSLKKEVISELMIMSMNDTLRTKREVGFDICGENWCSCGIFGFFVKVAFQTDKYSITQINERMESYLKKFSEDFKNISEEEMNCLKQRLKNFKLIADVSLSEEIDRNWADIRSGCYMFDRNQLKLAIIPTITVEDVTSYLQNLISPLNNSNYRKLSVQVMGSSSPDKESPPCLKDALGKSVEEIIELMGPSEEDINQGLSTDQFVKNLRDFANQLPLFDSSAKKLD